MRKEAIKNCCIPMYMYREVTSMVIEAGYYLSRFLREPEINKETMFVPKKSDNLESTQ